MDDGYVIREATRDDISTLAAYRRAMFESMGILDAALLDSMCAGFTLYLEEKLPAGDYRGWVADADGRVVACGGLVIQRMPPSPRNLDGRQGYILNVYTLPEWRGRGIATAIVQAILAHLLGIGVPVSTLHATPAGRPIYEKLGFEPTNEMRLRLAPAGLV